MTTARAILLPALLLALLAAWPTPAEAAPARGTRAATRGTVGPGSRTRWPGPLLTRHYLDIRLRYDRGRLIQKKLSPGSVRKPRRLKRIVGRFLARLYAGRKLMDVVPFNFPLLAPVENFTRTGHRIAKQMEKNLRTGTRLRVPFPKFINKIEIFDIATGRRWRLDLRTVRPPRPRPTPRHRATPKRTARPR